MRSTITRTGTIVPKQTVQPSPIVAAISGLFVRYASTEVYNRLPDMKQVFIVPDYDLTDRKQLISIAIAASIIILSTVVMAKFFFAGKPCPSKQSPQEEEVEEVEEILTNDNVDLSPTISLPHQAALPTIFAIAKSTSHSYLEIHPSEISEDDDGLEPVFVPTRSSRDFTYTSSGIAITPSSTIPFSKPTSSPRKKACRYNVRDERGRFTKRDSGRDWNMVERLPESLKQARRSKDAMKRVACEMALEGVAV